MKSLRVCRGCDLQAFTEEDLEQFAKHGDYPYGRRTICKECINAYQRSKGKAKRERQLIEGFESPIRCYFCTKEVTKLKGNDGDSIVIHSLDENHENWDPMNKVPSHRVCHLSFHNTLDRNPQWTGDEVSQHAKYRRSRRSRLGTLWRAERMEEAGR